MFGNKAGGLSINTGSANTLLGSFASNTAGASQSGGLFGSKPAGSLFGATTSAPSAAGTLFGTTTTQSSSLFGNTTTAPSQAGTLFGTTTGGSGTSLFGAQNTTSQPQQQSSLFGGSTMNNPSSQPAQGSIFGTTATQQPPQQSSGLFGMSQNQPQNQSQPHNNLFGNLNQNQNQPQPQGSIFGVSNPNANNNSSSLFSNQGQNQQQRPGQRQPTFQPQQTQRSIFATSIGQYTAQQQVVPGVRIDINNLKPTTKFHDLHESLQSEIEKLDDFISAQMKFHEECEQAMPRVSSAITYTPSDVDFCSRKLDAMQHALEADAGVIDDAKKLVKSDVENARLSFKAVVNHKVPQQFQSPVYNMQAPPGLSDGGEGGSPDLVSYFSGQVEDMTKKLEKFKRNMDEVENYLKGVEANTVAELQRAQFTRGQDGGARSVDDQVRELAAVLREFESGILAVASKVGSTREQTQEAMLNEGGGGSRRRTGFAY